MIDWAKQYAKLDDEEKVTVEWLETQSQEFRDGVLWASVRFMKVLKPELFHEEEPK